MAISILRSLDRYMLEANSRSSSNSWVLVKAVLILLLEESLAEESRLRFGGGVGVDSRLSLLGDICGLKLYVGDAGVSSIDNLFGGEGTGWNMGALG